ncbi:nitroreductase family deazaflavin-dependent oxidoreductase [Flindersiella endophytica]
MSDFSNPIDSPTGWVADHIKEYVETDGKGSDAWSFTAPTLLITTIGRKTGNARRSALIYGQDGDNYVIVASKGGAPEAPLWYHNLVANPGVELQVGSEKLKARARTAVGDERTRLWKLMAEIWPAYDEYQTKTDREIQVVVLEPEA